MRTARDASEEHIDPYEGGKVTTFGFGYPGAAPSARAFAGHFAGSNGITTASAAATQLPHLRQNDPTSVDCPRWSSENHTPPAVLYTVHGDSHLVPPPVPTTGDFDAPSSASQFLGLTGSFDRRSPFSTCDKR